jgi:hypothetical protein
VVVPSVTRHVVPPRSNTASCCCVAVGWDT